MKIKHLDHYQLYYQIWYQILAVICCFIKRWHSELFVMSCKQNPTSITQIATLPQIIAIKSWYHQRKKKISTWPILSEHCINIQTNYKLLKESNKATDVILSANDIDQITNNNKDIQYFVWKNIKKFTVCNIKQEANQQNSSWIDQALFPLLTMQSNLTHLSINCHPITLKLMYSIMTLPNIEYLTFIPTGYGPYLCNYTDSELFEYDLSKINWKVVLFMITCSMEIIHFSRNCLFMLVTK